MARGSLFFRKKKHRSCSRCLYCHTSMPVGSRPLYSSTTMSVSTVRITHMPIRICPQACGCPCHSFSGGNFLPGQAYRFPSPFVWPPGPVCDGYGAYAPEPSAVQRMGRQQVQTVGQQDWRVGLYSRRQAPALIPCGGTGLQRLLVPFETR